VKRPLLLILPLLVFLGVLATGCAPAARVEAALQATATPAPYAEETPAPDAAVPAPALEEPQTAALPADLRPDSSCIDCHRDAEQLQLVAEPEVVVESLNEGSG
jgi:hypothetical protein